VSTEILTLEEKSVASSGIAIGQVHIIPSTGTHFPKYWLSDKETAYEISRFRQAVQKSSRQLAIIKDKLCRFQGKEQIQILESHIMLLKDPLLNDNTSDLISGGKINAEWALDKVIGQIKLAFANFRDDYLRERRNDIDYIGRRILKNLLGEQDHGFKQLPYPSTILVAHDISPADFAALPRHQLAGVITASGGETSHMAIMARALEIPAIVGFGDITGQVHEGDWVVIDGENHQVIVNPNKLQLAKYKRKQRQQRQTIQKILRESREPAVTIDGYNIQLLANIDIIDEIPMALEYGAEGIGMYRTEYLFMNRLEYPSEEEQYKLYKSILKMMRGRPVTIRTLDIGGDKLFGNIDEHLNPALGLRAIRLCLKEVELFKTQLRALYRASPHGQLKILFPMITCVEELRQIHTIIHDVRHELHREKVKMKAHVPLGIMIEVPSAAIIADQLARDVQFFSIGTNDLIQYTLAIDRTNEQVSYLYQPYHPAIMRLLHMTATAARQAQIDITMCGEIAGDPRYITPLLGLGLNALSMNAISIPRVKKLVRTQYQREAIRKLESALLASTSDEVSEHLIPIIPDRPGGDKS
jgi:phosphotransferase system enzyme I (PtsI)